MSALERLGSSICCSRPPGATSPTPAWRRSFFSMAGTRFSRTATWASVPVSPPGRSSPFDHGGVNLACLDAPAEGTVAPDRVAIDFHDGDAGVGGFAATERTSTGRRHGRLLLAIGARRLCLFTGEDASPCGPGNDSVHCAGLAWERADAGALRLAYAGPGLTFPGTRP